MVALEWGFLRMYWHGLGIGMDIGISIASGGIAFGFILFTGASIVLLTTSFCVYAVYCMIR